MAEYDLSPLVVDEDVQGTYELLRSYFVRGNNLFNVVSDFINEDGFTIDFVRAYSFVASTHRATVHLSGTPIEGGTKLSFHVKSVEEPERIEKEIRDRLEDVLSHMLEQKRGQPIIDKNEANPEKDKRNTVIAIIVLAVIAVGAGITGILQQYNAFWSI